MPASDSASATLRYGRRSASTHAACPPSAARRSGICGRRPTGGDAGAENQSRRSNVKVAQPRHLGWWRPSSRGQRGAPPPDVEHGCAQMCWRALAGAHVQLVAGGAGEERDEKIHAAAGAAARSLQKGAPRVQHEGMLRERHSGRARERERSGSRERALRCSRGADERANGGAHAATPPALPWRGASPVARSRL